MAPYGVAAVLKETILFNLVLKDRAVMTTFFPNVLSGPMTWAGLGDLYPVAALGLLVAAVLAASRLGLVPAMMAVTYTFLFVAATPEPQYLPVMLYLALFGIFQKLEQTEPLRPAPAGGEPPVGGRGRRPGPRAQRRQVTPRA